MSALELLFREGEWIFGGGERVRTDDLLRARQALSQLSYTPSFIADCGIQSGGPSWN